MPSSDNSLPQHSPGPFTHGNTRLSPVSIYSPQYGSVSIAKVYLTQPESKKRTPEFAANLALFTASADLLAALKKTRDCLAGWMEIADDEDVRDYDKEALAAADAAIALAGGASPHVAAITTPEQGKPLPGDPGGAVAPKTLTFADAVKARADAEKTVAAYLGRFGWYRENEFCVLWTRPNKDSLLHAPEEFALAECQKLEGAA